jgi:light-regulated signal transduction histidine kinase (bacteriophytochrome)
VDNKRLEQSVRDRTHDLEIANRQLEAANRELESFSYSVSHDLRAPLRTIHGFCQIYMEDYKATIPAEGMPLLQRVIAGAERMDQLTEDLLALSRLGRQEIHKQRVQLKDIAQRVIDDLRARDPARRIEIRLGDLEACDGDPSLLEQVLVNLLSNAFKFSVNRTPAIVEIGCRSTDEGPVYFVRDNGAGFDMKYAGKLFGIFQRLHTGSEFAGTGVGLSIVQRIIHRHGGRVWAQSEPGNGATFSFMIPSDSGVARSS